MLRQFYRLLADRLLKKQIHHRLQAFKISRLDPQINRHLLLPQVAQVKIITRRGQVE